MDNENILKIIESSHFNFLIGSGASRNYLETLSNIETLLTELDKESHEDKLEKWYKVLNVSIKYWYYEKCIRGNIKLIQEDFALSPEKEIEFNDTNKNYIDFLQALNVLVLKRRNKLLPKEVNIFTTNMDLFLDVNLDKLGLEFNDGFSGKFNQTFDTSNYQKSFFKNSSQYSISSELPLFNLFKLHGSITWDKSSEDVIRYNENAEVLINLNKITFSDDELITLVKDDGGGIIPRDYFELKNELIKRDFTDLDIASYEKFIEEYDKLVMINPTKEKFENTTLRLEYYEQMRMYSNILERENSVMFVSGFSFADEHIKEITRRALNSNPTLLIIVFNFSDSGKTYIETLFPKLKYKNLYTDLIGYDFKKVVSSVFLKLASRFDLSINSEDSDEDKSKIDTGKDKK
ncbi:hypothetical protein GON26_06600 [Flavobacterium sp. GA093]|uniref:Uncharacterized protein n=1 Tax=Flavobacterium hydrocarbonoxydans TaxID=2683249 RepID=A0A6I4NNB5_9FLAO|nr:SIR2 family protein [Flavobacterium hydrocarbonoxydans]MWB94025.1 hypothetical protein [Flavobacterium hydrocarbonoxydans]